MLGTILTRARVARHVARLGFLDSRTCCPSSRKRGSPGENHSHARHDIAGAGEGAHRRQRQLCPHPRGTHGACRARKCSPRCPPWRFRTGPAQHPATADRTVLSLLDAGQPHWKAPLAHRKLKTGRAGESAQPSPQPRALHVERGARGWLPCFQKAPFSHRNGTRVGNEGMRRQWPTRNHVVPPPTNPRTE